MFAYRESDYEREKRIREEREQEEYWEEQRHRRIMDERRREEQAEEDYWFQQMQYERDLAKQAESCYAEQAQFYYLTLHIVHILRRHLNAILEKQKEEK